MKKRDPSKKCKDCRWLTGERSVIGIECQNPARANKWRTGISHIKHPTEPSCIDFEPKGEQEMNNTPGLKPCPFCGGEAEISWTQTSTPHPYARCKFGTTLTPMCAGATFFTYRYNTEQEAAEAWNRRAK